MLTCNFCLYFQLLFGESFCDYTLAADDYVYDFYAVRDDMDIVHEEASYPFPM